MSNNDASMLKVFNVSIPNLKNESVLQQKSTINEELDLDEENIFSIKLFDSCQEE